MVQTGNAFSASARIASYLIVLQLFTRIVTFTFNQLILRHTTPAIFGFATIQLELLSSTILFLSREGFRIALLRDQDVNTAINLAYIPSGLGVVGSLFGCWILWRGASEETRTLGGFGASVMLYGIAAVVELSSEPAFIVAQKLFMLRLRTITEGLAVVSRCAVTYFVTTALAENGSLDVYGALPFALGQLAYAVVLTNWLTTAVAYQRDLRLKPLREESNKRYYWFHQPTLVLALSITGQSLFKHILTEGDKFVLTMLTTPYTQGIYSLVSNYGIILREESLMIRLFDRQGPLSTSRRIVTGGTGSAVERTSFLWSTEIG
jgi:oligosaccharide translocation protein RFT1